MKNNSFKIFPRFWLVRATRTIHHNRLLLTKHDVKIATRCKLLSRWRQNDVKSAARCRLLNRWPRKPGDKVVLHLVSGKLNKERRMQYLIPGEKLKEWIKFLIKHDGYLRTLGKRRKNKPKARVFYISSSLLFCKVAVKVPQLQHFTSLTKIQ